MAKKDHNRKETGKLADFDSIDDVVLESLPARPPIELSAVGIALVSVAIELVLVSPWP